MPLILISGYPSSGKTHRSRQLIEYFNQRIATDQAASPRVRRLRVQHIDDDSLGLSRDAYGSVRAEKDARAAFASAIKRHLAADVLLVADAMNYIKGFRYQLYCEAKAVPTPSCVVHVGTPADLCRERNQQALSAASAAYAPDVFDNLIYRYEEPNGMTRWDSPLFTVAASDDLPPGPAIWTAMVGDTAPRDINAASPSSSSSAATNGTPHDSRNANPPRVRPNAATVLRPAAEQGYLYAVDRTTSDVVARIAAWTRAHEGEGGGEVAVGGEEDGAGDEAVDRAESALTVILPIEPPSLARLQALRRQFIALNRQHTSLGKARVRRLFVDYLNDAFQA